MRRVSDTGEQLVHGAAQAGKVRIGPPLVFERLWEALGLPKLLGRLLAERKFGFDVERAIFLTVLHRLFAPGSDRAAEVWRERYAIAGAEGLQLHHLYRAMAWLGEVLPRDRQDGATPFAARTNKDLIEEELFARRRDLFSDLDIVFFDTTSIYFEGAGGETMGQRGHSKDHRARPEADGGGHGAGPERQSSLQRTLAGQHSRREEPGSHCGTLEEPVRNRIGLHRG